MLTAIIFLPIATAAAVVVAGGRRPGLGRALALAGAAATLGLALVLIPGMDSGAGELSWRATAPWIPALGASYDVAVSGISLPLVILTAVLTLAALVYAGRRSAESRLHPALFLLMETGLIGVFSAQDLLLFYLFFEVGLVPMYFIIALFGHENRRYAALKFFLYTRSASLAILLGILGLYLSMDPHTFSLPAIAAASPLAGGGPGAAFVFFALLLGFGIKLPTVPLHNWLPDAHVEAPAEGSAVLAGAQLKMGGCGVLWVMIQAVPGQVEQYAWLLVALALASLLYGALAALGQRDLKRLVAFTSVNHMGFVLLGAGLWGLLADPAVREIAIIGATFQMVSHGILTGGMFLVVGMLAEQGGGRQMSAYGGLFGRVPLFAALLALLAFGSFGIPGMSGFVGEFQILGASAGAHIAIAAAVALAVLLTTGLYLNVIGRMLLGSPPDSMPAVSEPPPWRLGTAATLVAVSLALGIFPGAVIDLIATGARALP